MSSVLEKPSIAGRLFVPRDGRPFASRFEVVKIIEGHRDIDAYFERHDKPRYARFFRSKGA